MTDVQFFHQAYGLRKDGTIGPAEPSNPVAEYVSSDELVRVRDEGGPLVYYWSDGTTGPVERKETS